jgi:hypothetical protein
MVVHWLNTLTGHTENVLKAVGGGDSFSRNQYCRAIDSALGESFTEEVFDLPHIIISCWIEKVQLTWSYTIYTN